MSPITQLRRLVRVPFISINRLLKQQEQSSLKLVVQILIIQLLFYIDFAILWTSVKYLLGISTSAELLDYSTFTFSDASGLAKITCWLINSLIISFFISVVVGRSKLAWDFALTVHILNLLLSVFYNKSFPTKLTWWFIQGISALLIIFLGTYMSRFRELKDTFFDELIDSGNDRGVEMHDLEAQK